MLTGSAGGASRVVVGTLVQWHLETAVEIAEDVAAFATVMPTGEVAEVSLARGLVADRCFLVRLCVSRLTFCIHNFSSRWAHTFQ